MLYIHIGSPKTGTTAVQQFLAEHAGLLKAHGVLYPEVGLSHRGKHHALKAELRHHHGGALWAELRELHRADPEQSILVSEESFYYLDPAELAALPAAVGDMPVTVLVYFRDYASHAASLYAQGMKLARGLDEGDTLGTKGGNALLDFDAFFERYMAKPGHFDVIARWAAVFGWKAIRVRPYRRDLLVGGNIIEDLLDVLGLRLQQLGVQPTSDANSAPGWKKLETLRAVWQALERLPGGLVDGRIPTRLRNLCRDAVEATLTDDPHTEYLSLAQRRRCDQATQRDLAALWAHLPAPAFSYPMAPAEGERPFTPGINAVPGAELAEVIARLALVADATHGKHPASRELLVSTRAKPVKPGKAVKAEKVAKAAKATKEAKAKPSPEERAARKLAKLAQRAGKRPKQAPQPAPTAAFSPAA